jgi:hypothetical protein
MGELVGIFFFACITTVLAAYILSRHKERMTIIDKGLKAEDYVALYKAAGRQVYPMSSLKWGLILTLVGIGVLVGLWLQQAYDLEEGLFFGLIALAAGLGLLAFYAIARKHPQA